MVFYIQSIIRYDKISFMSTYLEEFFMNNCKKVDTGVENWRLITELSTCRPRDTTEYKGGAPNLAHSNSRFSPDGALLASGSYDGTLLL